VTPPPEINVELAEAVVFKERQPGVWTQRAWVGKTSLEVAVNLVGVRSEQQMKAF
jgi:hypothetical protein